MPSRKAGDDAVLFLARLLRAVNEAQKQPALGYFLRSSREARGLMNEAARIVLAAEEELRGAAPAPEPGGFEMPNFPKQKGGDL